ncbi:MAG: PP2C family protein-serine/threonine phosphatase [Desulfopila sp.]
MKPAKKIDKEVVCPDEACLRMAAVIERELLPKTVPVIEGADISGWTVYSHTLGGDFFDYFDFSGVCCQAPDIMRIVVGDACGHGLCSALLMTSTRSYLRARAMQPGDLPQVVNDVNRLLYMDLQANKIQILGLI